MNGSLSNIDGVCMPSISRGPCSTDQAPIGIFRQVARSTYDDQARAQVTTARGGVEGDDSSRLDALLHGGDTWTVA